MSAVCVTRTPDGFTVSRAFRSMAAAQRALDLLLSVNEAACVPSSGTSGPELGTFVPSLVPHHVAAEIMRDLSEQDDPPPHDGRLWTKPSDDEE